jgi:hypothetical protein
MHKQGEARGAGEGSGEEQGRQAGSAGLGESSFNDVAQARTLLLVITCFWNLSPLLCPRDALADWQMKCLA